MPLLSGCETQIGPVRAHEQLQPVRSLTVETSQILSDPGCLPRPRCAWSLTAFTGLSPPVNGLVNGWLAPGIMLGISHLSVASATRQQSENSRRGECEKDGVKRGRGRSPPRTQALSGKRGFLKSWLRGQRSGNRAQMWPRSCSHGVSLEEELLFWEMP